jgi:putative toxin-antitoxin system antitoxin component (TIGR02293 family)
MSVLDRPDKELPAEERAYLMAADLLGVRNKLVHGHSRLDIHEFLTGGLQGRAVTNLRRHCRVLIAEGAFEQALGMSLRTVQRLEADKNRYLSSEQSSRAWKLAEIVARATSVLGSEEAAQEWLTRPARALEGKRPTDLLATQPGMQLVEDLLQQMDYGVYV